MGFICIFTRQASVSFMLCEEIWGIGWILSKSILFCCTVIFDNVIKTSWLQLICIWELTFVCVLDKPLSALCCVKKLEGLIEYVLKVFSFVVQYYLINTVIKRHVDKWIRLDINKFIIRFKGKVHKKIFGVILKFTYKWGL